MTNKDFRKSAHAFVDWMADYMEHVEEYPVKSQVKPGDIKSQIPISPPIAGEPMDEIFNDFKKIIMPGISHWQHPSFHAYFPGNSSKPSVLAEMLTSTLGIQAMIWNTSPSAAELEEQMMLWFKEMMDLPKNWAGSIQNGASDSTLNAILTAREKISNFSTNDSGITSNNLRVYCSEQAHSSLDKAMAIAGLGKNNLVKITVDNTFALNVIELEKAILTDKEKGLLPLMVIAALGTTGTTAFDPLEEITLITEKYKLWLHVDAALAGTALVLPEMRWMSKGLEKADSFVFNPHKWMFTNFDASVYFVKDKSALINTFSETPEYLKTEEDHVVTNYRDWGVPLGRRFRALKLWFVLRSFGVEGIQEKIRLHLNLSTEFKKWIEQSSQFKLMAPVPLNTICFRYHNSALTKSELNTINETLLTSINSSGKAYLTHTKLNGWYTIRMVIGQTNVNRQHTEMAFRLINNSLSNIIS
jgi:aromatic-L-amino-acid/L-tryptophan decarboxylase